MFWVYVIAGCVAAFGGGWVMLFTLIKLPPDPSTIKMASAFLLPALGYWLGVIVAFLYGLGEAFKP